MSAVLVIDVVASSFLVLIAVILHNFPFVTFVVLVPLPRG